MALDKPTSYQKSLLKDLGRAWLGLYQATIHLENSELRKTMLACLEHSLSWSSPLHLAAMQNTLELVQNLIGNQSLSHELQESIKTIALLLKEYDFTLKLKGHEAMEIIN